MNWLNKHLSFKADVLVTLLNGLVVIGGVFVLNGLIARLYGLDVLGEFLLIKRTLSAGVSILLIGMNIGLPNYLSRNFERAYTNNAFVLFIVVSIPLTIIFIGGLFLFDITGFNQDYFWLYVLFAFSMCTQFMTYALYRGYMNMLGANVFQLLGTAIIPIIVFYLVDTLYDGLFWIGGSIVIIMFMSFVSRNKGVSLQDVNTRQSKELLQYGLKRIPSFISQFILLAGIPIMLAQTVNFESVAYFNSSLSLVRLALLIINPLGMVLLPRIANMISGGSMGEVQSLLKIMLKAGIVFSLLGTIYIFLFAPLILEFWLGEVSNVGVLILRFSILALPFYTFAGLTRSPIDAVSEKGYNSLVYGLGAVTMVITYLFGQYLQYNLLSIALFSFLVSHLVTGLTSAYFVQKLYQHRIWDLKLLRDIAGVSTGMILIHYIIALTTMTEQVQFVLTSIIYLYVGIIIYRNVNSGWLAELKSLLYA
ncbi:MAG TPA: lipopolysaccharide biosynthesis protein [Candidatus Marinimicrobia bacterium]|jgi:O-antigen/teichoic acid export membrane protein|nr:hypothetical protein [Candidatus Neomarinimicrobiota bacterium]HJM70191.1 lipopolysaccharide biosynthesis protein [Candidatus Neomarinimicrobiota bacterium]|tara:strand:+ start:4171 stop:5604 length:1434 start_codon:yes stop_codon:yes gene_type:complete